MFCQIVQKKFPLRYTPYVGLFVPIEANEERSDHIEFAQIGQGIESFDFPDHTSYTEQSGKVPKHRELVEIKTEPFVSEQLSDVKEISCTAPKIENSLRTHQIDFHRADPPNVDVDPSVEIQILRPVHCGTCNSITLANLLETLRIDRF